MTKQTLIAAFGLRLASAGAANPTLTIDAGNPVANVSPIFYGLMTEEINHSYDGGLYAELVQNRAFLDNPNAPVHWSVVLGKGSAATMALDPSQPLNDDAAGQPASGSEQSFQTPSRRHCQRVVIGEFPSGRQRSTTPRFTRRLRPGLKGRSSSPFRATMAARFTRRAEVSGLTQDWKQYEVTLETGKVKPTAQARYVLTLDRPGKVWFDLVSLFPPTWDNQPNGFRPDLMQMLVDLKPHFLRFPGGNYVEGDTIATRFDWKKTIGPLDQRPGHPGPWGYRSTDGMGLLEFLRMVRGHGRRTGAGGLCRLFARRQAR